VASPGSSRSRHRFSGLRLCHPHHPLGDRVVPM